MRVTLSLLLLSLGCGSPRKAPPPPPPDTHGEHAEHAGDPHAGHAGHHAGHGQAATSMNPGRGAALPITCGADAQKEFDQGFFALHNMDYAQARGIFEAAAGKHTKCAMLHWGVAMTYFQPLWSGQPTKESMTSGAAAAARAKAALTQGQANQREHAYVAAVAAYYDHWEKTDTGARLKNWAAALKRVAETYPDDIEAQAFYALGRLATADKKDKTYSEPLAVAEGLQKLLEKRPDHPGLMHYLIHAYDNPAYAKNAVAVTKQYEAVSPGEAHALHMPSHIHVRLGNWQEVVDWNIKSEAAGAKHPVNGRVSRDVVHAIDYRIYGYLQMGDDENAKLQVAKIDPKTKFEMGHGPGAYGIAATPARYALERRMWKEAAALVPKAVEYNWEQYPWAEAVTHAARGLGAARSRDFKTAEQALKDLDALKPKIESAWWQGRLQIERDVIAAWVAYGRKDKKKAETLMRGAADREIAAGKDNVEPGHVISAIEELGDLLLELKRAKDALEAYKTALKDSPRRLNALYGAGRAAEQAGNVEEAKAHYTQLLEVVGKTSTRPVRAQAEAYLKKQR